MKNISKRIDTNIVISEDLFSSALFDTVDFLCGLLIKFLEKEGRFLGIVKSYINSIDIAFSKFYEDQEDCDVEIYGKVLYLLKPLLIKEFSRLRSKKISEGDCVILIMRRLLTIVLENPEYSNHKKEVKTVLKIINSMYNNIKNRAKKDSMYNFSNNIKNLKQVGAVGKYYLDSLELSSDKQEKIVYQGDGLLIENSNNKISEQIL